MISRDLKSYSFGKWYEFSIKNEAKLLASLPQKKGVYAIKYETAFGRFKGESDIMGFGSSVDPRGGLRKRIRFYFHPGKRQKKNQRIRCWLEKILGLSISYVTKPKLSDGRIRDTERDLRRGYEKEHGELPPWDRRE